MVFSMQSLLRYYNWDWSNQFNAQLKARLWRERLVWIGRPPGS
jgi:hypothetical protein